MRNDQMKPSQIFSVEGRSD